MSIDAIRGEPNSLSTTNPNETAGTRTAQGLFMGHRITVLSSPVSLLADAAEELSFSVDRTKDFELAKRKEKESSEVNRRLLERYLDKLRETDGAEKLLQFVKALKSLKEKADIGRLLSDSFKDATDCWAALQFALDDCRDDPLLTGQLQAYSKDYIARHGSDVKLGLQGAVSGLDYPDIGNMNANRDFYRQTVGEFSSVNEVFDEITREYGEHFDRAMDFLFSALSADIAADQPSMEKTHLENVHGKLQLVRLTQSAYRLCEEMIGRWKSVHGMEKSKLTAMALLADLLALKGKTYIGSSVFDRIALKAAADNPERKVLFLQELLCGLRRFPIELFDDPSGRNIVMDALRKAVDRAIEAEDEWLAAME